ncbi:MAG: hypothetical protein DELT_01654 [Desulfovibrio sp.]
MSDKKFQAAHNLFVNYNRPMREIYTEAHIGLPFGNKNTPVTPIKEDLVAIWDTGATSTTITRELADSLKLVQSSETIVEGVTGSSLCRVFLISLFLPNDVCFPELEVSDCEGNIGCDILIGMDVIGQGDFAVTNKDEITTFSFRLPSIERINFTDPLSYGGTTIKVAKIPPNDPCPCGSGKKYKTCCRNKKSWVTHHKV